jgi:CPA1 family monovalent cation:H+ antiporter
VLFNLAIAAGAAGLGSESSVLSGLREFATVSFMGLAVGFVLGYIVSQIILSNVDDHLIETATTLALAYGAYVIAEQFHWSGILAVVTAGLFVGNFGVRNTSPTTKIAIDNFWELLAFIANSLVFLLIGLRIDIVQLQQYLLPVLVAVLAILVSRGLVVYGLTWLHQLVGARHPVPIKYRRVLFWGGLRGAISLALALTLTDEMVGGEGIAQELRFMTFGVVLFTLLVQGLTIERVIKALGLSKRPEQLREQQRRQALVYASRAGRRELDRLSEQGILAGDVWRSMTHQYDDEITERNISLRNHLEQWQELEQEMVLQAREDALVAERAAVIDAARRGLIAQDVNEELLEVLDNRLAAIQLIRESSSLAAAEFAEQETSETTGGTSEE